MIEIIYCADGNKRFAETAFEAGFTYGAQVPNTVYLTPEFVDQNWHAPNLQRYVEAVIQHRPRLATVLDWERWDQLDMVIEWAETVAPYVSEAIIIIPKVIGGIACLPRKIGGVSIRLGYSVPTAFGATLVHPIEFLGWPIHLLGGSPLAQAKLAGLTTRISHQLVGELPRLDIISLDINYHLGRAVRHNQVFVSDGSARYAKNRYWPTLKETDGRKWGDGTSKADAPYEAFRRSCKNIMAMWRNGNKIG